MRRLWHAILIAFFPFQRTQGENSPCSTSNNVLLLAQDTQNPNQWCIQCSQPSYVCEPVRPTININIQQMPNDTVSYNFDANVLTIAAPISKINPIMDGQTISVSTLSIIASSSLQKQPNVSSNSFQQLTHLTNLALLNVDMPTITATTFSYSNMQNLTVNGCNTVNISLPGNNQITTLSLSNNKLQDLPNLSNNLKTLDVSQNVLQQFPVQVLQLQNPQYINLSGNKINQITLNSTQLQQFKNLANQLVLKMDPVSCSCGSLSAVSTIVGGASVCICNSTPLSATTTPPPVGTTHSSTSNSGPSSASKSATTSHNKSSMNHTILIVLSCVAAILAGFVFVVLRRRRGLPYMETLGVHSPNSTTLLLGKTNGTDDLSFISNDGDLARLRIPQQEVKLTKILGGDMWYGQYADNKVVLKRIEVRETDTQLIEQFIAGIKEISALQHPNLTHFMGVSWLSGTDLCAITELMSNGSLTSVVRNKSMELSWDQQVRMCLDIAEGLEYAHNLPGMKRRSPLTSRRIFVNAALTCKLGIFDYMSTYHPVELCEENYGTQMLAWVAPEIILHASEPNHQSEVYSAGVIFCEIALRRRPYEDLILSKGNVVSDVVLVDCWHSEPDCSMEPHENIAAFTQLPLPFQTLIGECLVKDPTNRPSMPDIVLHLKSLLN